MPATGVDIRSEGSLTGDVIAQRISIEDGAFFKGGIDIRKPGQGKEGAPAAAVPTPSKRPSPFRRRQRSCTLGQRRLSAGATVLCLCPGTNPKTGFHWMPRS